MLYYSPHLPHGMGALPRSWCPWKLDVAAAAILTPIMVWLRLIGGLRVMCPQLGCKGGWGERPAFLAEGDRLVLICLGRFLFLNHKFHILGLPRSQLGQQPLGGDGELWLVRWKGHTTPKAHIRNGQKE